MMLTPAACSLFLWLLFSLLPEATACWSCSTDFGCGGAVPDAETPPFISQARYL